MRRIALLLISTAGAVWLVGCGTDPAKIDGGDSSNSSDRPIIGYVTNGIATFWSLAEVGAEQAGKDFDVQVEVRMPPSGTADQKRMTQELIAMKADGIAISPIDSANQGALLEEVAEYSKLITHDSDAPDSPRLCYIGMDNYDAGRMCGQLIKKAIPDGGNVAIFVGRLSQDNARLRRQGVIDELLDRSHDASRYDSPDQGVLEGDKYSILDTRTDDFDFPKAKAQAQEAITRFDKLDCMVGLFAYNPPLILEAVREARKLDAIKIVGFDEADATLQGIIDGEVYGTIVQNPYMYGYESVRVLAGLVREDPSVLPEGGMLSIPGRAITKDNVAEFWAELKEMTGQSAAVTGTESESP